MDKIELKHRELMNELGGYLNDLFIGYGFALLVFDSKNTGRMNYLSNAKREDMLVALKEFIANFEGTIHTTKTEQ